MIEPGVFAGKCIKELIMLSAPMHIHKNGLGNGSAEIPEKLWSVSRPLISRSPMAYLPKRRSMR
ncbi:hypothetical protein ES703_111093 [subsurface metagenome]